MPNLEVNPSREQIKEDQKALAGNDYPGRVIVMGRAPEGDRLIQIYALMDKDEDSKDKLLRQTVEHGVHKVKVVAPGKTDAQMAKVPNASLIYYDAMIERRGVFTVSNGAQTEHVSASIVIGHCSLLDAVGSAPIRPAHGMPGGEVNLSSFEPDEPNFTPRITGLIDLSDRATTQFGLAIVRRDPESGEPIRTAWETQIESLRPGIGYGLHTYAANAADGKPLPAYDRDPFLHEFVGKDNTEITGNFWRNYLDAENRVAIVVRSIGLVANGVGGDDKEKTQYAFINKRQD